MKRRAGAAEEVLRIKKERLEEAKQHWLYIHNNDTCHVLPVWYGTVRYGYPHS